MVWNYGEMRNFPRWQSQVTGCDDDIEEPWEAVLGARRFLRDDTRGWAGLLLDKEMLIST